MRVYLPYTYEKGDCIYYRRVVPARLRQQVGKTEIKIRVGHRDRLPELIGILRYLSKMSLGEVARMAKKSDDSMQMTDGAWDSILRAAAADRPDTLTPAKLAVLSAIDEMFGAPPDPVFTLKQLIDKFIKEKANNVSPSSIVDITSTMKQFLKVVGDKGIKNLTIKDVNVYRESIEKSGQAPSTKGNKINRMKEFFRWLKRNEHTKEKFSEILEDIKLGKTKRGKSTVSKSLITDESAIKIHSALLPEKDGEKPWHYWIFMLCLFHGARPHEICQLDTSDIAEDSTGIPCLAISEEEEKEEEEGTKNIKNENSMRIIPIHPFLLKQGFWDYVEARRKTGEKKLFSLGKRHPKNGYTQTVAKFYTPLIKKKMGLPYSLKHCRKTFETKFNNMDITNLENKIQFRITGRAIEVVGVPGHVTRVVWNNYILLDYPPSMMLPVLEKLKFTHENETIG